MRERQSVRGFAPPQRVQEAAQFGLHFGEVVGVDLAPLRAEAEAVVFDLEERDGVAPAVEPSVENQDARLDAGVRLEDARRERDDRDEAGVDEHLPQGFVGRLALEDDAFGHDDSRAPRRGEVLGHVVHEEDFAALGLDRESPVGADAALGRHKGRIGEDDVGVVAPAVIRGERVVFVDARVDEAVKVEVHERQPDHVRGDVVPFEVSGEALLFVGGEGDVVVRIRVGATDVLERRDQEPRRAARGVEDAFVFLRVDDFDHEVDDVARRSELARIALGAEDGEQVFEGVPEPFGVVVREFVDDLEEAPERFRVAVGQVGVLEDVPEERRQVRVLGHSRDAFRVEVERFVPPEAGAHESGPAVPGEVSGEEGAFAAEFFRCGVHVVHEFVDQRDGDLFDLRFRVGHLADEDVAGGVDSASGVCIEQGGTPPVFIPWRSSFLLRSDSASIGVRDEEHFTRRTGSAERSP